MDTKTNLNGETTMSMDAVDFLSNEVALGLSIRDDNGEANEDDGERLFSNEPMSTDGKTSLKSTDSDLNARGPQRQRHAVRNTGTHPYVLGIAPHNNSPIVTAIHNQWHFSNAYTPPQYSDYTLLPKFNTDIADGLLDSLENNEANANNYPITAGNFSPGSYSSPLAVGTNAAPNSTQILAVCKSSQFADIELSPEPAETSPSSGYVSSQDPYQCDSASMPSDTILDYALDLMDEYAKPDENINVPAIPLTIDLQTSVEWNANRALFSTPLTNCKTSSANGLGWQKPTNGCTTNPPTYFLKTHNGVISNDVQPHPNIPETFLRPAFNGTQAGHPMAPTFLQGNQLAVNISTPTDRGFIPRLSQQVDYQPISTTHTLDMDPQANLSSRSVVNGTNEMVTQLYPAQPFLYGASCQMAMANVTYTQTASSNGTPGQMIDVPLSYWPPSIPNGMSNAQIGNQPSSSSQMGMPLVPYPHTSFPNGMSAQSNAPVLYPQTLLSGGTFCQLINAQQQHLPSSGTGGRTTTIPVANQQPLATHKISNQIVSVQQYKQPPPYGISGPTNAQMSYPQTRNGASGHMVKGQVILCNQTSDQVNADTKLINKGSVNPGIAPGMSSQKSPPTTGAICQRVNAQMVQLQPSIGQYVPPAGSVPLKNVQSISGVSQGYRQPTLGQAPVACMPTNQGSSQQVLPVTQALQAIQQPSYTFANTGMAVIVNNSQGVYNGCSPVPQVFVRQTVPSIVGTSAQSGSMYVAIQPKLAPDQGFQPSNTEKAQQIRKKRGTNIKRQTSAEAAVEMVPSLTVSDANGDTPLHVAVCKNDPYLIKAMLSRLEREGQLKWMDCKNNKEQTPLYLAVFRDFPGVVSILVEKGADPNYLAVSQGSDGKTECKSAIHVASMNKKDMDYKRTLSALLKSEKLNINNTNNYCQTALHCAILAQCAEPDHVKSEPTLRLLLEAGADVRMRDKDGLTPLMYAVIKKQVNLVKFLISYFKDGKAAEIVKITDYHNHTAMDMAAEIKDTIGTEIWNILNQACT